MDHDLVVLMGDLNYRLSMPDEDARAALRKGDLQALRDADELTNMRNSGVLSAITASSHVSVPTRQRLLSTQGGDMRLQYACGPSCGTPLCGPQSHWLR